MPSGDFTINDCFSIHSPSKSTTTWGGKGFETRCDSRIRNPHERFQEDKLRMLRAVNSLPHDFSIEPETMQAIRELAMNDRDRPRGTDCRRDATHAGTSARRALAAELLKESNLLRIILPETSAYDWHAANQDAASAELRWKTTLALLETVSQSDFPSALALLIRGICRLHRMIHAWRIGQFTSAT